MSLLASLRSATAAQHQHLDQRLSPPGLWSAADYIRLLRMTLTVVAPLEPAIGEHLPGFSRADRSRADAIRTDLQAIGAVPGSVDIVVPDIRTRAEAMGAAYVLQGSMLGGAIIKRAIERDLPHAAHATSYLDYLGPDLGHTWKAFTTSLDTFGDGADAAARRDTVRTAQETFAAFDAALTALTSMRK